MRRGTPFQQRATCPVFLPILVVKNALRHTLRTTLTVVGIVVAITAFGLLRTIVDAWYSGANASSSARLVTRSSVSLVFPLPLTYAPKLRQVPGVTGVTWANWFGGVYISERNFFPQFGVDAPTYLDIYPEIVLSAEERKAFLADRKGAIVGRKLADKFGWKVGDQIPLRGTIYAGTWTFTLRGIYDGADATTDTSTMYFHWSLLNEMIKRLYPRRADQTGVFIEQLSDPQQAAEVSQAIDATFRNSLAETLTETEKAFQLVMANTMAMTARERSAEYATLKALGFGGGFVAALIFGESIAIALVGGVLGIALTFPLAEAFAATVGSLIPSVAVSGETVALQVVAALLVGVVAASTPAWRAARTRIVDGLRAVA
jgi:putative ABC transport system permease protein